MGNKNSANSYLIQSKGENTISIPTEGPLKPLFPHSIKWRCANPADFAYINKLRPKLLSRINFSNIQTQISSRKAVRSLSRVLADAKRSSRFSIENSRLDPKQLHEILNSTNHLKKVKINSTGRWLGRIHISNSLTRIGRNKDLLELTVSSFNDEQGDETYRLHQRLKQLRKLEYMNLDLPFCKSDVLSLQPLRSLKSFGISFGPNPLLKQRRLPHLLSRLCKRDRFTELTLDFEHFDPIDLQETQLWTSFFQKAQSLKSLTLFTSFRVSQDYSGFQVFPNCFKFMKHLTALRVHLDISPEHFDHNPVFFLDFFFDSLKSLSQLKKLEFVATGSYFLKKAQIKHLAVALGRFKNLHTLDLNFFGLEFSSGVSKSLAKNLKNLSCLKHFKLEFAENRNSNDTAIKTFAKSLTHLPLKSLDLALSDLKNKHKVPFLSALSSFKDLVSLHIDFPAFASHKGKDFYLKFKNPHKLASLSVGVGQFDYPGNFEGLSKFMLCLKVMPNLTTLKLNLSGKIVCDQEVALFLRNLDGCPNLHLLKLTIENAGQLTGKALDSLQAALVKLTKLEYLEVILLRRSRFENHIVNKFLCVPIVLKRLKEFVVNFESSPSFFPDRAWKESVKKLKNCRYLTKVEINFDRYL